MMIAAFISAVVGVLGTALWIAWTISLVVTQQDMEKTISKLNRQIEGDKNLFAKIHDTVLIPGHDNAMKIRKMIQEHMKWDAESN